MRFITRIIFKAAIILVAVNLFTLYMTRGSFEQPVSFFAVTGVRERMDDTKWFFESMAVSIREGFMESRESFGE